MEEGDLIRYTLPPHDDFAIFLKRSGVKRMCEIRIIRERSAH